MRAILLIPVMAVLLTGCGSTASSAPETATASASSASSPATTPAGSPSATPTMDPDPSASPTATADASAATCENLLDPASVERGEAEGGDVHTFTAEEAEDGGTLEKALDYGGIACSFGVDGGDSPVLYAYGPISDDQAAKERAHLDKLDLPTGTNEHGGTYYGAADDTEIYVFSPAGYWAYQYNNGFGTVAGIEAIEEVVANAPAFY